MAERSRTHRALAAAAAVLGVLAFVGGDPSANRRADSTQGEVASVTALDLARWLREGRRGVRLLDLRPDSEFAAYHIPGAAHVAASDLSRRRASSADTVVIYAEDDAAAERVARMFRRRGVDARVLRGGLLRWIEQIGEPRLAALPPTATAAERAARREQLDLSRYFGGMPSVSPIPVSPIPASPTPGSAVPGPSRQSEAPAVARILRRGC